MIRRQPGGFSAAAARAVRSRRTIALGRTLVAALAMTAAEAWPVTCTVTSPGVAFGAYNTFSATNLDVTGTITVTCSLATPTTISLSAGAGSFPVRKMTSGARSLNYNLYTTVGRTTIWGDGTAATATVATNGTSVASIVYGRVLALQNAFVGTYSDTIIMTIVY